MKKLLTAGLATMIALFPFGCSDETPPAESMVRPVRTLTVAPTSDSVRRTFSGIARAETETKLSFQVGGIIQQIDVSKGQAVKRGDRIAAIDTIDIRLRVEEARAAVENARVQQDTAKSNLNRIRELYESDNVALSEYEAAKNQSASARATYASKQKQLDLQKRQLSYGTLYAPADGYVAEVPVEPNETVQAGQLVAVIISGSTIEVEVGIPGDFIQQIRPGLYATVQFAHSQNAYTGRVTKVSQVSSAASTYPVSVQLDQTSAEIRPGMPAEVSFAFDTALDGARIHVPATAVGEDAGGRFVYVVQPGPEADLATVRRTPVTVGRLTSSGFEIQDGLTEGAVIVTAGVSQLTDNMTVRMRQ